MASARHLLEEYVRSGKLMQVATLTSDGSPAVCNVWYDAHFQPDVLRFISRHDRHHSEHIRNDARVAGSIIAIPLDALGQQVRGVTFTGRARELPCLGIDAEIDLFTRRWPASTAALNPDALARAETPIRLYDISVNEWVLFDEANFPEEPRKVIAGVAAA